ncbi:hypothetical protein V8F06_000543 [Rhypophila decipiens]
MTTSSTQGQGGPRRISTFEQFVKFVTDASGLERTFRLLQAITQILCSYEPLRQITLLMLTSLTSLLLFSTAGSVEKSSAISSRATTELIHSLLSIPTLIALRSSFALGRRFFRVGRFLDSFRSAWKLFSSFSSPKSNSKEKPGLSLQTLQIYLAMFSSSFNGLYLLLETLHFPEVLLAAAAAAPSSSSSHDDVVGERQLTTLWGADLARTLHVEGQRFWFLSLVCGVAAGTVKLINLWTLRRGAVPSAGSGQTLNLAASLGSTDSAEGEDKQGEEIEKARKEEQKTRLAREREEFSVTSRKVGRRVIADLLDLVLPGTVVGWVEMGSGMVGVCMLGSTWLTGLEVWERCGGGE